MLLTRRFVLAALTSFLLALGSLAALGFSALAADEPAPGNSAEPSSQASTTKVPTSPDSPKPTDPPAKVKPVLGVSLYTKEGKVIRPYEGKTLKGKQEIYVGATVKDEYFQDFEKKRDKEDRDVVEVGMSGGGVSQWIPLSSKHFLKKPGEPALTYWTPATSATHLAKFVVPPNHGAKLTFTARPAEAIANQDEWDEKTNKTVTAVVDTVAPKFTGIAYIQVAGDESLREEGQEVSVTGPRSIRVAAEDQVPEGVATGDEDPIRDPKITASYAGSPLRVEKHKPFNYDIVLSKPGKYELGLLKITATDKVGNWNTKTAATIRKRNMKDLPFPSSIQIRSKEKSDVQVVVDRKIVAGKDAHQADVPTYVARDSSVYVRSRKQEFAEKLEKLRASLLLHQSESKRINLLRVTREEGEPGEVVGPVDVCPFERNSQLPTRDPDGYFYYKCPDKIFGSVNSPDTDMKQRNGKYTFSPTSEEPLGLFNPGSVILDGKKPQVSFKGGPSQSGHNKFIPKIPKLKIKDNPYQNLSAMVVSQKTGSTQYAFYFWDELPEGQLTAKQKNEAGRFSDTPNTSGLNKSTLRVELPAPRDLTGKEIGPAKTLTPDNPGGELVGPDRNNLAAFQINAEGLYRMDQIKVHIADNAGNMLEVPLAKLLGDKVKYDVLVVDRRETSVQGAQVRVQKAKGTPESTSPELYYRGDVNISYTVSDRWFPLYVTQEDLPAGFFSIELKEHPKDPASRYQVVPQKFSFNEFVQVERDRWQLGGIKLPRAKDNPKMPKEGAYNLKWAYRGFAEEKTEGNVEKSFTIDYTGPKLGKLQVSPTGVVHAPWIFASSTFEATLGEIEDTVSGIDDKALGFKYYESNMADSAKPALGFSNVLADQERNPKPKLQYKAVKADMIGTATFRMSGDSQRLRFDQTAIGLTDKAGNPADTGYLGEFKDSDLPTDKQGKRPVGVVVDKSAPTVEVAFDNNNARNQKYYKAGRTATVTVKESNFDLLRKLDRAQVVVTNSRDGNAFTVPVEQFENPSGDKRTWVYRHRYDADGDWKLRAEVTDLAGRKSNAVEDEFVLDKLEPQLTVTFDNNHPTNGMYYNHPRTATVTIVDRNFSQADSPVVVQARDDAGRPTGAPSGGWAKTGKDTWSMRIPFTGESHYALLAKATDMAGNAAHEVKEPEFVIDTTKPEIKIGGVENLTAYSGTVRPVVVADDTNLDHSRVEYRLNGNYRGAVTDLLTRTKESDNHEEIIYDDFDRDPKVDDIYQLNAKVTDMAGNSTEVMKTFSVNRFGSTYLFEGNTGNLRGKYLDAPQNVQVTEVNVSGLENNLTQVQVAKNDQLQTLSPESYSRIGQTTKAGWSATKYTIPAKLFNKAGYYRVLFSSIDKAGNLSQNTMDKKNEAHNATAELKFAIDKQKPQVRTGALESNKVYYDESKDIDVNAKDNLALSAAQIEVDGQVVRTWDGAELDKNVPAYRLAADAQPHDITLRVQDKAGNESVAAYSNVVVARSFWRYLLANPLLLAGVLVGAALVGIGLIALIVALVRRRRRLAYRHNPFGM